ncbi:ABC transporter permease [Lactococcus termiticola]|uniref:Spermidine/putrescine ABC transporter permease protein n=1 Tax=Lactococcus termiticola TaxID=2169526 RepID=A0A2R5HGT5_9LACT|nr:ABC transporter permease [Lactococcus termiticola]GBG97202.1 spermidine/putrescine ABC transporter permease protein [Lactococcus termiticola]
MKHKHKTGKVYLAFVLVLLYLPIFYLIFYAFNAGGDMSKFTGFTWENFQTLFADSRLILIVVETFFLAFLSSLIATIIGTFGAIAISSLRQKRKDTVLGLNNVLMVSPDVVIGASFLILFSALGLQLGFVSVLLAHIAFSIPIVVLMVLPLYQEMDKSLVNAAHDLGASRLQAMKEVVVPFLTPGIIAGFFMAFTYSLDDFAVTFFVTGNSFTTLSVEIYSRAREGISLEINALSAIVFLFSILLVIGYYMIMRDSDTAGKAPNIG